jgi:hypothetical protein
MLSIPPTPVPAIHSPSARSFLDHLSLREAKGALPDKTPSVPPNRDSPLFPDNPSSDLASVSSANVCRKAEEDAEAFATRVNGLKTKRISWSDRENSKTLFQPDRWAHEMKEDEQIDSGKTCKVHFMMF